MKAIRFMWAMRQEFKAALLQLDRGDRVTMGGGMLLVRRMYLSNPEKFLATAERVFGKPLDENAMEMLQKGSWL